MGSKQDCCYRYDLWKTDTETLLHSRLSTELLDIHGPNIIDGEPFPGYPKGYEWRVYRDRHELGRWAADGPSLR